MSGAEITANNEEDGKYGRFSIQQNGLVITHVGLLILTRMRNPHNAVSDTIEQLRMRDVVEEIVTFEHNVWTIRFESLPNALIHSVLEIQVIEEEDGDASVCVMLRSNIGRRSLNRLMTALVDNLDDEPREDLPFEQQPPPGGQPSQPS